MDHLPKYYSISRKIIGRIHSGELLPGMKVPSENELIREFGISNTTARKVLHEVERAGWVVRIKGRGTFVREKNIERSANKILSFTRNMREAGHVPSTKVLDGRRISGGYAAVINGRRYAIKGPVFKIHRLRFANDTAMMLEVRYISLSLCPGIEKMSFGGSLYELYQKQYGHQLTEVNQMLSTTIIDESTSSFFDIKHPVPAFRVESVTFCGRELVLEMEDSLYRGDKYRFSVRAQP